MATRAPAQSNGRAPTPDELHAADMVQRSSLVLRKAQMRRQAGSGVPGGDPFAEIGTSGLRQYGGFVVEEWLRSLSGRKAAWAFREIADNSPVVGAILFAIEWLARQVETRVEPGNDTDAAEFVESCLDDMSHSWPDFVSEALSVITYGWSWHEIVYKKRQGPQAPRALNLDQRTGTLAADTEEDDSQVAGSRYKDGRIGWRKLPVRAQETLLRWHFDGYSGLAAMEQIDWHGGEHVMPIEKALLFRARPRRSNPEGFSCLRNAFVPYYRLKNIEQIEAIGIERDLAGIPTLEPPEGVDLNLPQNAALLKAAQELVTSIRRDEYEGVVYPSAGWVLKLIASAGTRQINTDPVVRRYEQRIATSMLADFILIGQDAVGSFAMVDVKSDLFSMALDGILGLIADVMNRHAIPRLLRMNGMDITEPPEIRFSSAGRIDPQKVGDFLQSISLAGARIPWSEELLKAMFSELGLPANFEEQAQIEQDPAESPDLGHALAGEQRREQRAQDEQSFDAGETVPLTKAETHSGVMVALYPETKVARKLAVPGGEPQHELHLTLTYHGHVNDLRAPGGLVETVRRWAESTPPLQGRTSGVGKFVDGPSPCTVALCDMPHLGEYRQRLVEHLERAGMAPSHAHGYTPHITLAYDKRSRQHEPQNLSFDHATVKIGDERHDLPLLGVRKDQPTSEALHIDSYGTRKPKPKRRTPDREEDESRA